jgi:ribosomal protein S18 acetylase RimI-like enzyme/predicted nucleic acid-binding protein
MTQRDLSVLIDTNVIIHLEDNLAVNEDYSELYRLCQKHKVDIFIHERAFDDINRDNNIERRTVTLSKLKKYQELRSSPARTAQIEDLFGKVQTPNDAVDTALLFSLYIGAVDILVTEDKGILRRASNCKTPLSCYSVGEALDLIRTLKEPIPVKYPYIEERNCYELELADPIFNSLRETYNDFNKWYKDKCITERRNCWVIFDNSAIAALAIKKDETRDEVKELGIPGDKILKLCLFKVAESSRGERYGEQLLKQAMDYCFRNKYDSVYLTTYPQQISLIHTLEKFGFQQALNKKQEQVFYKNTGKVTLHNIKSNAGFDFHKKFWPQIKIDDSTKMHIIPIRPKYHSRLFPEYQADKSGKQLHLTLLGQVETKTPGNAIRKVYISKARYTKLSRGDIIIFYKSQDSILTTVGVVERVDFESDLKKLTMLTGNRTVYSLKELSYIASECKAPLVINFYFSFHLDEAITLNEALQHNLLKAAPESIVELDRSGFKNLMALMSARCKEIFNDA